MCLMVCIRNLPRELISFLLVACLVAGCVTMRPEVHPYDTEEYFCKTLLAYQSYIQFDAAEDTIGDRQTEVELCLKRGTFDIYYGWYDVKYRSFVWELLL